MPDMNALMPKAPDPSSGLLTGNPLQVLGAIGQINQAKLFGQTYEARQNIGNAYRDNTNPDGSINRPGLMRDIGQGGGFLAGEGVSQALGNEGTGITNVTNQRNQDAESNRFVADRIGSLAVKPDVSADDVHGLALDIARTVPSIPTKTINSMMDIALKDPQGIKAGIAKLQNIALGASGISSRLTVPDDQTGAPTSIQVGSANYPTPGKLPGQVTTGLSPGQTKSSEIMQNDLDRAKNYQQEITPWNQALDKLQQLGPGGVGPGSKGRQEAESFMFALNPTIARWAGVDPAKIKNYAEAEKYLTNATQTRAAGFGSHTDMQLSTALTGSPNVHINQMAAVDVTKMAIALRRMEQTQTLENAKAGGPKYTENSAKWGTTVDPRAFAIDLMPPEQVEKLQKELKGAARDKFNRSLRLGIENGVITPPQGQ